MQRSKSSSHSPENGTLTINGLSSLAEFWRTTSRSVESARTGNTRRAVNRLQVTSVKSDSQPIKSTVFPIFSPRRDGGANAFRRMDFSTSEAMPRRDQRERNIIKTFLRQIRYHSVIAWKIVRGKCLPRRFLLHFETCARARTHRAHRMWQATRGFDDAKCHLADSTAPQRVE